MKIVFFVHCFFPDHFYGTETYTLALAKNYKKWGHDVSVVSALFQGEPAAAALVTMYSHEEIPVYCIDKNKVPHSRVKETYYQEAMKPVFIELLGELKPDLVHVTHLINHTSVLLEAAKALGIPTYATFTDFFGFCLNNKLEAADGELCSGPSQSRSNCVACYIKDASRSAAEGWMRYASSGTSAKIIASTLTTLRKMPGIRNGEIHGLIDDIVCRPSILADYSGAVAPTAFLKDAYAQNNIKVPMRALWFGVDIDRSAKPERLAEHVPVVGFIGQIAPHKGTDLLVEAFKRLPLGSARLRIFGPEDQDPAYMAALKDNAKGFDVEFKGTFAQAEMAQILRDIDVLVIPSRWYENSPLVLLNALATHTPVLVSDVAGMTEFLQPGINGEAFARGSVSDLHQKLLAWVNCPATLYALAQTTNFERTLEIMAAETFAMYSVAPADVL
jgi:glycosyltransferase involved in cell wall biosynthesis